MDSSFQHSQGCYVKQVLRCWSRGVKADQFIQLAICIIALFLGPLGFRKGQGVSLASGRDEVFSFCLCLLTYANLTKILELLS